MLRDRRVHTTLPVADLDGTRAFWEHIVGFEPDRVNSLGALYRAGEDTWFSLARTTGARSGTHTQMVFTVPDLAAEVADLRARGVVFEEYDLPGLRTVDGIANLDGHLGAWFKDPEGNVIAVFQFGAD